MEVKAIGEHLQCHQCQAVCYDYGHSDCQFQFPHNIVSQSSFDEAINSIHLKCLDPTCNYFNPYLLVFGHHNHDIKCILSGKSAKAAMFYISDYITKSDKKLYQIFTLFSKAIAQMLTDSTDSKLDQAKQVLHHCLSALLKKQEIHAPQAICYICEKGDGMSSHECTPMFSGSVMHHLKSIISSQ